MVFSNNTTQIGEKLQQDIVKIDGHIIFINPFLYRRKLDNNTNRWLHKTGQISQININKNRNRFYPEIDWFKINKKDRDIKDATIEMFLKTLNLIRRFHPSLSSPQLSEVEKKMITVKKQSFEKWVKKSFASKAQFKLRQKKIFERKIFLKNWKEWFSISETKRAVLPVFVIICISFFLGWSSGVARNSCNPYFESAISKRS